MKQDNRINLESDVINLNKKNITNTFKDLISIYIADKHYDSNKYCQYKIDPATLTYERGLSMLPISRIGYKCILRPLIEVLDGLSTQEILDLPKSYIDIGLDLDIVIELYCQAYELSDEYMPEITNIVNKTLAGFKA